MVFQAFLCTLAVSVSTPSRSNKVACTSSGKPSTAALAFLSLQWSGPNTPPRTCTQFQESDRHCASSSRANTVWGLLLSRHWEYAAQTPSVGQLVVTVSHVNHPPAPGSEPGTAQTHRR